MHNLLIVVGVAIYLSAFGWFVFAVGENRIKSAQFDMDMERLRKRYQTA